MKGLKVLLTDLSSGECPSAYGLKDINREPAETVNRWECKFGDGENLKKCYECFLKALEIDYEV